MSFNLDKSQLKAVESNDNNILLCACPGSGKTTVIINRIKYLIETIKSEEKNIFVVTFTKAAAENMKKRYINAFNKEKLPLFCTFHRLFYRILLNEGYKINIINESIKFNYLKNILKKYYDTVSEDKIKEVLNNISVFKTSDISIEEFTPTIEKSIFIDCFYNYINYNEQNNLIDFDDIEIKALKLFKNKCIADKYKKIIKYILVDEFQDSDELQIKFLKIINDYGKNSLFAVGDEDQCIYSFRGSKPEYMISFNQIFKGGVKYYLSKNYRSSKNIVEYSKKVILFNKGRNKKEIIPSKSSEGIIKVLRFQNEKSQSESISSEIKKYGAQNSVVIYRGIRDSAAIVDAFIRDEIPFRFLEKGYNFFEHFICKDLIEYLKLASDINNKDAFINIINKPFRYISSSELKIVTENIEDITPFDVLINRPGTNLFQLRKLYKLKKAFISVGEKQLDDAIDFVINNLKYMEYLKSYCDKYRSSINDFINIIDRFKITAVGFSDITSFLNHIKEVNNRIKNCKMDNEGVILSTIHGVKGMEFKNVFIINCCEDNLPHISGASSNIEEERRIFYVAVTRAIENLFISYPYYILGEEKRQSRFIDEGKINIK